MIQRELVKYVAIELLEKTGEEFVQQAIKALEEYPRRIYTLELPDEMREYRNRTLFTVSSAGGKAYVTTTPILNQAAVALCCRVSARLAKRTKKKEQTCQDIIGFLLSRS